MTSPSGTTIKKIGNAVSTNPALPPSRTTLRGSTVTLYPLRPEHAEQMYTGLGSTDNGHLWTYMPVGPFATQEELQLSINAKSESSDPFFFAIIDTKTQLAVGHAAMMRIDLQNRVIEVGNIIYSSSLQRTRAATEVMYLLAKHVFDDLGYRRYEWKCDNYNEPSKSAAKRLGFTFEGVFRQHMIYKGRNRDTAWFSILDSEWPGIRAGFERWLDDSNFGEDGKQIKTLQECRMSTST